VQAKRHFRSTELISAFLIGESDEEQLDADETSLESHARTDASSAVSAETSLEIIPFTQQSLKQIIASCISMVDCNGKEDVVRLAHETTIAVVGDYASKQSDLPLEEGTSLKGMTEYS
jgi:hypothetical protein